MQIAELTNISKSVADRPLFSIDTLSVYSSDRIGCVGANGSGKTTFLKILAGLEAPDSGSVKIRGPVSYIPQFAPAAEEPLSGGEQTRRQIDLALQAPGVLLLADEPTSNLDGTARELLERRLKALDCAMLIVSHDRAFLDSVCNRILAFADGSATLYDGNYTQYLALRDAEQNRKQTEYEHYAAEKRRLEQAARQAALTAAGMRKTPKRMGNSEARLHKLGNQKGQKAAQSRTDALLSRLERLEVKEKPMELAPLRMDATGGAKTGARAAVSAEHLNINLGGRILFENASFRVLSGSKTALTGPNGSGKTTLLNRIAQRDGVEVAQGLKPGYFRQDLSLLDDRLTLLQNLTLQGVVTETQARTLLSRMQFARSDCEKPAAVLSGGERVKAALCRVLTGGYSLLLLDEPTNYLDIVSLEALEETLAGYGGTLLFVSHDRRFVEHLADHLLFLEHRGIASFDGTLAQYQERKAAPAPSKNGLERMLVENRLSAVIAKLSSPGKGDDRAALEQEYQELLRRKREL